MAVDPSEGNCLSYYHAVVAPALTWTLDGDFWSIHVPQILGREPAARHAVLAIGALYRALDNGGGGEMMRSSGWSSVAFALRQYNQAIEMVLQNRVSNHEVLLTVSLLFTCIELLQGNADAAFKHCQHGLRVHSTRQLSPELSQILSHLSIYPQFLKKMAMAGMTQTRVNRLPSPTTEINTLQQARQTLDATMAVAAQLLGLSQGYLDGNARCPRQELERRQISLRSAMDTWWDGFVKLKTKVQKEFPSCKWHAAKLRLLETRWIIMSIMTTECMRESETAFDAYLEQFERVVELADEELVSHDTNTPQPPNFLFEMGYLPLLYLVAIKCRALRVRVRALVLMKDLASARETVWDARVMYSTARWAIEFEHGLTLDEKRMRSVENPYPEEQLPTNATHIIRFVNQGTRRLDEHDRLKAIQHRVMFYIQGPAGVAGPLSGYAVVSPWSVDDTQGRT